MPHGRPWLPILLLMVAIALPTPASAQKVAATTFPAQIMEPAMGLDSYFSVEGPGVSEHLGFTVGLMLNYQYQPVVLRIKRAKEVSPGILKGEEVRLGLVDHNVTADVVASLALRFRWFKAQIGLGLPIQLYTVGTEVNDMVEPVAEYSSMGMGEIKVQIKVMLLDDLAGFSLALSPIITVPTGAYCDYCGDEGVGVRPRLVAGYRWRDLAVAINLGYLIRKNTILFSSEVGDQMLYGVAASYQVHPRITIMGELFGRAGFETASGCGYDLNTKTRNCDGSSSSNVDAFPMELDLGVRVPLPRGLALTTGAGIGLVRGIGTPAFRVLAGLRWAPDFRDMDKDGVADRSDECPAQAEDVDGFQDSDGCPDPDNDGDLIIDARDRCPMEAEDRDTFEDEDGCPEKDNDKDGIDDLHDHCPLKAETKNGFKDEDGCPDVPDADNDGVEDSKDKCPQEAEDRDNWEDEDGCPDPDNDMDGVPDQFDDCPFEPEDMDNFQDDDGCPDDDNDEDGVADDQDQCDGEKETINGFQDDDGCPDRGPSHVQLEEGRITITGVVEFTPGAGTLSARSHSLLGEVALLLKSTPKIKLLRVEGHADASDEPEGDNVLSRERAEAVRNFLIERGVRAKRLVSVGYGRSKPLSEGRDKRSRIRNGRIEFSILELATPKK